MTGSPKALTNNDGDVIQFEEDADYGVVKAAAKLLPIDGTSMLRLRIFWAKSRAIVANLHECGSNNSDVDRRDKDVDCSNSFVIPRLHIRHVNRDSHKRYCCANFTALPFIDQCAHSFDPSSMEARAKRGAGFFVKDQEIVTAGQSKTLRLAMLEASMCQYDIVRPSLTIFSASSSSYSSCSASAWAKASLSCCMAERASLYDEDSRAHHGRRWYWREVVTKVAE